MLEPFFNKVAGLRSWRVKQMIGFYMKRKPATLLKRGSKTGVFL